MTKQLLRLPEVKTRTGCSRSWIYAAIRSGEFPAPIALSARCVAWVASDIDTFIDQRIEAARAAGRRG